MENNKTHILVVDDDDRIRDLLKDYLTENRYLISTAGNAEQAKSKIRYLKFDLLILDVMMPGKDGYTLTREIKKEFNVPIILLTAKGEVENRIKGLELGADDYLGKPFEPKELLLRIKNIVNKNNKIDFNFKYSVGNAEFMVMLPFLIALSIKWHMSFLKPIKFIAFAMLLWNLTFAIIPHRILDFYQHKKVIEFISTN